MNRRTRSPQKSSAPKPLTGRQLVEALLAGWRPLQRLDVAGFAVLRSRGVTKRANSAVAMDVADDALGASVTRVEELCALTGEAARFRVFDTFGPAGLDALLAERGYTSTTPNALMELPLTGAPQPTLHPGIDIRVGPLDEVWFDDYCRLSPRDEEGGQDAIRAILSGTPAVLVRLVHDDGGPAVAVGRAALVEAGKGSAVVLNCVVVDADRRRRGLGRAVTQALLAVSAAQGAQRALLELEQDNAAARSLYAGLGFKRVGGYHYRTALER